MLKVKKILGLLPKPYVRSYSATKLPYRVLMRIFYRKEILAAALNRSY